MTESLDAVASLSSMLTEQGPLHRDEIAQRFRDSGVADPDAILNRLLDEISCPAQQLIDGRWAWLPTVLAGRVFTHRVRADELTHDLLVVTPDLDPITRLCEYTQYRRLADGAPVQVVLDWSDEELLEQRGVPFGVVDEYGSLLLPPGALGRLGVAVGDLVGVRLTASGLVVERVGAPEPAARVGERLAATLGPDEPVLIGAAVWTACVDDSALFTEPLLPLSEIADDYGLVRDTEYVALAGFDFARWRFDLKCEYLAQRYDIDAEDSFVLNTLLTVYDQMAELLSAEFNDASDSLADEFGAASEDQAQPELDGYGDVVAQVGSELADPVLAEIFLVETVRRGRGAAALGLMAETLEPKVARNARVACRWLRAVALERMGDIESAEREFLTAESMDTQWPLALLDLARFASDRGDVERGLALLRRAGVGREHPLAMLLENHRAEPRNDVGRNEACWCGSGRKYKKCHLRREQLPLTDRVRWLYVKACQHVDLTGWSEMLIEVSYERGRYDAAIEDDPLPIDAVLFEGGAFEDFLELRGSLLPDDERLLAEQWLLVDRSVFEVQKVDSGRGVTVRDVRTGDTHDVHEKAASRHLKPGQLICARVVPDGESNRIFGGIEPVALHERDELIALLDSEPDPEDLVAYLSRRFAPPTLTNTDGELLALCEATVRVDDPTRIAAALDNAYDRVDGEEPPQWLEHIETDGMPRIRASLILDGDTVKVEANSENRMDRVLAVLAGLDPAVTVLDDSRQPISDVRDFMELDKQMPDGDEDALDSDSPELVAARDAFIRDYESKWLDMTIPALDGHTPREAADDPTRRADVIRLLDSFPADGAGRGGMDVGRLRDALGLR